MNITDIKCFITLGPGVGNTGRVPPYIPTLTFQTRSPISLRQGTLNEREDSVQLTSCLTSLNSPNSGLLHLTGQPYCKKGRSAKVKDGIINLIVRNYLIHRYMHLLV
jgi:hypothetical protein